MAARRANREIWRAPSTICRACSPLRQHFGRASSAGVRSPAPSLSLEVFAPGVRAARGRRAHASPRLALHGIDWWATQQPTFDGAGVGRPRRRLGKVGPARRPTWINHQDTHPRTRCYVQPTPDDCLSRRRPWRSGRGCDRPRQPCMCKRIARRGHLVAVEERAAGCPSASVRLNDDSPRVGLRTHPQTRSCQNPERTDCFRRGGSEAAELAGQMRTKLKSEHAKRVRAGSRSRAESRQRSARVVSRRWMALVIARARRARIVACPPCVARGTLSETVAERRVRQVGGCE